MLYYVYIISYTFFFSRTSQGVSRFHCYILCKIVFWRYLSPSSSHLFFFLSLCARAHVHLFFFLFFFFSDKCHLWFVYKVYVCIIHSYVLRVYALHSCFIHIHIYICVYQRVCVCVCVCVYVCVDPCVRTRLIHLFIAYHLCRVVTNYTYIVQGFFFFSFARLLLLEFASSDCIHLLSLKYMQRGCHGTPRAVHRIRGNTSRKFSFF